MYPMILVAPRIAGLSVELRPSEDPAFWETYYKGNERQKAIDTINVLLSKYPDFYLTIGDKEVKGYIFQIRTDEKVVKFFKSIDSVRNPFYNRKMYANASPNSVVSFRGINT